MLRIVGLKPRGDTVARAAISRVSLQLPKRSSLSHPSRQSVMFAQRHSPRRRQPATGNARGKNRWTERSER